MHLVRHGTDSRWRACGAGHLASHHKPPLEDSPELEQVIHLRTLHLGPDSLLIAAKVAVRPQASGSAIAGAIDAAEQRVRAAVPIAQVIYLEPDLYRAGDADTGDPAVRAAQREPGADLTAAEPDGREANGRE